MDTGSVAAVIDAKIKLFFIVKYWGSEYWRNGDTQRKAERI